MITRSAQLWILLLSSWLLWLPAGCFDDGGESPEGGSEASSTSSSGGTDLSETSGPLPASESSGEAGSDSEGGSSGEGSEGSTGAPGTSTGSSGGSGAETDGSCVDNADCAGTEVCSGDMCVDAWLTPHALRVLSWDEPCDGAGTNTFFVRVGAEDTPSVGCPQAWPDSWFTVGSGASVRLDFYEAGSSPNPDQLVTQWCWDFGMGCAPIPKAVLHAGEATVMWGAWSAEFEVVPL